MEKIDINKLNELYRKAEEADKNHFSEMRSNILLNSGEHYKRIKDGLDRNLRQAHVSKDTRVRLTKNHIKVVCSKIQDILLSQCSDFQPTPKNENELQDQKSAEIAAAVWAHGKEQNDWPDYLQRTVHAFTVTGEAATKVHFDPTMGTFKGYEQKVTETGEPVYIYQGGFTTSPVDEMGNQLEPAPDESKPIFNGKVLIEKLDSANVLRDPNANTMKESPYLIVRKMVDVDKLKAMFASTGDPKFDEEMSDKIQETADKTFKVFDSNKASYVDSKGQAMVKEFYFRQCTKYPKGYIYMAIENEILYEGEIPYGEYGDVAFPIKTTGYDLIETCPRYSSPIKNMRPNQAEINRCASSISETQITIGSDKVFMQGAGKLEKGASQPGIRVFKSSGGPAPQIIPGRSGDQYTGYLKDNIQELYEMHSFDFNLSKVAQSADPKALMYKSASQQAKYSRQGVRLEGYLKEVVETYLFVASKSMDEEELVEIAGKNEAFNIAEFRNLKTTDYMITVSPVSGDYNTMYGKHTAIELFSQYFGKNMDPSTQAAMIKAHPFLNKEPVIKDLMLEYDTPRNMLLSLDRGEDYQPSKYDDSKNMLKRLYIRIREPSFKLLAPEIQQKYQLVIKQYEQIEAEKVDESLRLKNGMIPSGGSLTKCDLYVNEPNTKGGIKTVRATVPSQALEWLIQALEKQGLAQQRLEEMESVQGAIDIVNQSLPPIQQ